MTYSAAFTIVLILGVVGLLAVKRLSADLVMLGALALLLVTQILTPAEALAGFANEGLATIAFLFVVAAGIRETDAIGWMAHRVLGRPQSVLGAQARLIFPVALLSGFLNNTPIVAMMLPVVDDWAKKTRISPSKLMIPLSYATILGGLCTLIGTSTNLIVNGLLTSQTNHPGLRLFDVTWIGVPCALVGLSYILVFSRWLLPDRVPVLHVSDDARQYMVEMVIEHGSGLIGQTIERAGLRHLTGLFLAEIEREGEVLAAVPPHERLRADDRLLFVGIVESVIELQRIRGLKVATDQVFKLDSPRTDRIQIEAVVSDTCPLVGQTIRAGRFRTAYNAAVIAVARNGERLRQKIGDIELHAGDTLLLEAHPSFVERQRNSRDFYLVSRVENSTPPRHEQSWTALAILAAMVLAAGLGGLSMVTASLAAAILMVLTRCCSWQAARRNVDGQVLLLIGASLGVGQAMQKTHASTIIAGALIGWAGDSPWLALAMVYLVTMTFTEIMSHAAAVVLVFPIALATAGNLAVDSMPFTMALMMAASCGFATPFGYQTNTMVYGPGGYHFRDYLRFGAPLNALIAAVTIGLAPWLWPFRQ